MTESVYFDCRRCGACGSESEEFPHECSVDDLRAHAVVRIADALERFWMRGACPEDATEER